MFDVKSEFLKLNSSDFIKGLIVAVFSALITFLYQLVSQGGLAGIDFGELLKVVILATLAYLAKNFTTNSQGQPFGRE